METANLTTSAEMYSASEHETKFVLNNSAAGTIIRWLQCRCRLDDRFEAGIVSSIYYDTHKWRFLCEKINSDYLKTKIRLRWYSDIDSSQPGDDSFIEAKYKTGTRRAKVRVRTDVSGKWLNSVNLDNQKLLKVPELLRSEGVVVSGGLFPVFKIVYKRRRFIEPVTGSRLSIDYDISAPSVNRRMLVRRNPNLLSRAVFELKGDAAELPGVLQQLTALGCRKESFSKYGICYGTIMRTSF